jgi:hypothetical protein
MNWPGENLILKLWESLAEKGIGSLLRPWQIRREGRANIDLRRYEMLALAEAERESEEIRSGRRRLENTKFMISLTDVSPDSSTPVEIEGVPLLELASHAAVADSMRKEINVAKAVLHAEEELRNDDTPPQEKKLEDDWLYRWRDYAGSVSSEELQAIWGRILAGELKSPGLYSYRLMDFVRNLTKDEANLIEKIAPFVLGDFIARDHDAILENGGVTFSIILQLQDLGILSGAEALGLSLTLQSNSKDRFLKVLLCHGRGLLLEHDDATKTLDLGAYVVTTLGRQVIKLGKFIPNEDYLLAVGSKIQKSGFKVSLVDYSDIGNGMIRYSNAHEMPNAQQVETQQPPLADLSTTSPVT